MEDVLEYLPEEYFETKAGNLFYSPPDDSEEFMRHYVTLWPVRMWVHEELDAQDYEINHYSVLGVWSAVGNSVKFVPSDFEWVDF